MWEKAGYINRASIRSNFRLADVIVDSGTLLLETKTGPFSFGGISSKFCFRGDFDVKVDCMVNFYKNFDDIDQVAQFKAADKTEDLENDRTENVMLELFKKVRTLFLYVAAFKKRENGRIVTQNRLETFSKEPYEL
jgi:hypothetical protein